MRLLQDQVVVITGAASGIGREAALRFAACGARVVAADQNTRGLETLVAAIRAQGRRALAVPTDTSDMAQVEALAQQAEDHFGRLDTWVNNAAVSHYGTFEETPLAEMRRQMDVNYWGYVHGLKAAIPRMRAGGGGTIVLVTSVLSDFAVPLQGTYCAAKHALRALAESLRIELMHDEAPIRVSVLKPPSIDTPFFLHARTRIGYQPKPFGPAYDPSVVAREIVKCAVKPRRELLIGGAAKAGALGHLLAPRLFDWLLARKGYQRQMTETPKAVEAPDNLEAPLLEPGAVRVTGRGYKVSWVQWVQDHPGTAIAGVAAAAVGAAVLRRR